MMVWCAMHSRKCILRAQESGGADEDAVGWHFCFGTLHVLLCLRAVSNSKSDTRMWRGKGKNAIFPTHLPPTLQCTIEPDAITMDQGNETALSPLMEVDSGGGGGT